MVTELLVGGALFASLFINFKQGRRILESESLRECDNNTVDWQADELAALRRTNNGLSEEIRTLKAEHTAEVAKHASEVAELEARITAMESVFPLKPPVEEINKFFDSQVAFGKKVMEFYGLPH